MLSAVRVLVTHLECPDPFSNDARLRQLHRQIAGLAAAGNTEITVITLEAGRQVLEPAGFVALGIDCVRPGRRPLEWLAKRSGAFDLVISTDVVPEPLGAAIWATAPRRVALLHRLASHARRAAELDYRVPDASGLAPMIDALQRRERAFLGPCDTIICASGDLAEAIELAGADGALQVVTPPLAARSGGDDSESVATEDQRAASRRLLHVGRWASGTSADAQGVRAVLATEVAADFRLDRRITFVGEDVMPAGRQITRDHPQGHVAADLDSAVGDSAVAVAFRATGPGVPARILELASMGLPVIGSAAAFVGVPSAMLLDNAIVGSAEEAAQRSADLLRDPTEAAASRRELAGHAATYAGHDQQIARLLDVLDVTSAPADSTPQAHRPIAVAARGAFDFNREMKQFESELIPEPALDRDQTALLQPQMTEDERYRLRVRTHEGPDYFDRLRARATEMTDGPTFSIVMPTYNIDRPTLLSAVESVRGQVYERWQLCVVDDASPNKETRRTVAELADLDARIQVRSLDGNMGIAGATMAGLELATGDFVALLDHDDELRPDALWWNARLLQLRPDLDIIYSDEDKLNDEGERWWPFHKPDWSPAMLTNVNYVNHFLVMRRTLLDQVGGYRPGFDGAQDYDLVLRLTEATERHRIGHIAKPLYSWRTVEGSTAADIEAKPEAHDAGHRALSDSIERQGLDGWVEDGSVPTVHRVRYRVPDDVKISILIPTKDRVDLLEPCLHSIREKTRHTNYELIIVDNNTSDPETVQWLDEFARNDGRVVRYPHQFNFARQMNLAAAEAIGELVLFLNNDVQVHLDGWLTALAEQALLPDVGVVGARLLFPDGRTQHEGIGLGMAGPAVNLQFGGHRGYDQFIRDAVAVTGAVSMVRSTLFADIGGFDERLRVAFNDVDLCLRIAERGYRNVYTPLAELAHPESASRGSLHPIPDEDLFHARWGTKGELRDPWLNANFEWFFPLLYRL